MNFPFKLLLPLVRRLVVSVILARLGRRRPVVPASRAAADDATARPAVGRATTEPRAPDAGDQGG